MDNNLLKNALFFAERLLAHDHRSPEASYLLALCHLRLGDNASAYEYAKQVASKGAHLGCIHVFAQAALELGRYKDGILVLEKFRALWQGSSSLGKHTSSSRHTSPDAAVVNCLLGKLYCGYDNKQKAIFHFEEALKLNPFMWDALTSLCDMGMDVRVPAIFKMSSEMEAFARIGSQENWESQTQSKDVTTPMSDHERPRHGSRHTTVANDVPDPFNNAPVKGFGGGLFGTLGTSQKLNESNPNLTNIPAAGGGGIGPDSLETPNGPIASVDNIAAQVRRDAVVMSAYSSEPPQAPARKHRAAPSLGMDFSTDAPKMSRGISTKRSQKIPDLLEESAATQSLRSSNIFAGAGDRKRTASGQVAPRQGSEDPGGPQQRRSVRLFNQIRGPSSKQSSATAPTIGLLPGRELKKARPPVSKIMRPNSSTSTVGRQVSGNRKPVEDNMDVDHKEPATRSWIGAVTSLPVQRPIETDALKQEEALCWLLELLKKFGNAYFSLSKFRCLEAIQIYSTLPRAHQETPWVLAQVGRAYYEQASYADAEKFYKRLRQLAPTRFEDMEIFSTILWYLKRETDLAFLAHELIDSSWQSPEAWCALGNSWSLARDHEQALRCFKRATQLNPKFAYAFTLQGHEHVENEEYEKAQNCYRAGMAADSRHYNAWYGMGRVYDKLGNYEKAIAHFTAASQINPTNAVLICCIGTVLEKQKHPKQALTYYTQATELAPRSTLTRFKKARTLMALSQLDHALQELMVLKDLAPEEPMVHFLLGRLYKNLREKGLAVRHFTIALNLDPKVC
jgi:anaphase-promoting complex subunit 3